MDKVEVKGLSFHAKHGCHPEERKTGGPFSVDLTVYGDFKAATSGDSIHEAVDYVSLMQLAQAEMDHPRNLIETVARSLAERVLASFSQVQKVTVTIKKIQPPVAFDLDFVSATTSLERAQN